MTEMLQLSQLSSRSTSRTLPKSGNRRQLHARTRGCAQPAQSWCASWGLKASKPRFNTMQASIVETPVSDEAIIAERPAGQVQVCS